MVTNVQVWIFCLPQPVRVPSHPPGSLRNPHIELIITSQPLPSLITHILKLLEQSILHWMQIAVAEQSPQPLKVLSFSVFVLKKYRPARWLHSTSLCPVDLQHNRAYIKILFKHLLWQLCMRSRTHTHTHTEISSKLNWLFVFLLLVRVELWDESLNWWKQNEPDYIICGAQSCNDLNWVCTRHEGLMAVLL